MARNVLTQHADADDGFPICLQTLFAVSAKEIDMMVEIKNDSGLCMTCNNAPSCFNRARRGPALFCETFDDFVPTGFRLGDRIAPAKADPAPTTWVAMGEPSAHAGLCKNCDDRRTCGHPKPDGGVWHCEDYR